MESHRRGSRHATGDDSHTTSWSAPRTGEHLVHAAGDQGVDALEEEAGEETAGCWRLPARGGEACPGEADAVRRQGAFTAARGEGSDDEGLGDGVGQARTRRRATCR
jgi:hypothetical protein